MTVDRYLQTEHTEDCKDCLFLNPGSTFTSDANKKYAMNKNRNYTSQSFVILYTMMSS